MACPQPDIFIKISKEFFEALCRVGLPRQEGQVLNAIILETWGFHRKEANIANSRLREITGLSKFRISKAAACLAEKNMIVKAGNRDSATYSIQKDYEKWLVVKNGNNCCQKRQQEAESPVNTEPCAVVAKNDNNGLLSKTATTVVKNGNRVVKNDNKAPGTPIIVKERLKKDKDIIPPYPPWLDSKLFEEFVSFRKKIKKPMTEKAVELAIKKLDGFRRNGMDPSEIIETSIMNGWQGLFPLKNKKTAADARSERTRQACIDFITEG